MELTRGMMRNTRPSAMARIVRWGAFDRPADAHARRVTTTATSIRPRDAPTTTEQPGRVEQDRRRSCDSVLARVDASKLCEAVAAIAERIIRMRHGPSVTQAPLQPRAHSARIHHPEAAPATVDRATILRRASAYLGRMPPAVSGQGGHARTYAAATVLVHGFCLTESEALDLLQRQFNPRCDPPWSDRELQHKVADAITKPHHRPRGWLLDRDARPRSMG